MEHRSNGSNSDGNKVQVLPKGLLLPFILITSLFAWWGLANNMTDTLLAAFKKIMSMTDFQTSWIQVAFYGSYFCLALPAALYIKRFTYKSGVLLGLGLFIGGALLYLGIAKKWEPLLLVPIGFSIMLVNLPLTGLMETEGDLLREGLPLGLFAKIFRYGIQWEIIPPLIFLALGAMTDFGPVIANPKTLLLGAAAQFGVYFTFFVALLLPWFDFSIKEACAIGIIGGSAIPFVITLHIGRP